MKNFLLPQVILICLSFGARIEVRPLEQGGGIRQALDLAVDGDTLVLAQGIYRETIEIKKSVTLEGNGKALLDPSEPWTAPFLPAPEVGPGVYSSAAPEEVRGLLMEGRFVAALDEKRAEKEGAWHWRTLLKVGPPLSGFERIRALYLWKRDEKKLYLSLGGQTPVAGSFRWVRVKNPAVTFHGARSARVQNLQISGAATAFAFLGAASDCVVQNCSIRSYERMGIEITDGSERNLVVSNAITRGSHESWAPRETGGKEAKAEYEIWQIHKNVGFYDRMGMNVFRGGSSNRILSNDLHETFDGIDVGDYAVESLAIPLANPEHGKGTEIAWNVIRDVRDSGMEIGGGAVGIHIHHNLLLRTHGGLRFKLPRIGPIYIHHNWLLDDRGFQVWFSMDSSPAEGFFYQNTVAGRTAAVQYSSMNREFEPSGTPRWVLARNLVVTTNGFFADRTKGALKPNFASVQNLVQGPFPMTDGDQGSLRVDQIPIGNDFGILGNVVPADFFRPTSRLFPDGNLPGLDGANVIGAGPLPPAFKTLSHLRYEDCPK